ncbi:tetratricopeptide repeat protein [Sphingomonas changbaiensis]|uniref:tetratricopeptide repeat protein n=1 Tax=Sphingomonas changbaiensis TaxID=529705 RepID=UPI00147003AB|nr:hypothetical protein [Sphingomonas changbaiensis]
MVGASLFLVLGLWLVLAVGVAGVLRDVQPRLALTWAPWDARAKAKMAEGVMAGKRDGASLTRARSLSESALARDPMSIVALRNIGLIDGLTGHIAEARRTLTLANKLSKRDLGVHLWLIEDAVSRNNIDQALLQYDEALRTSSSARDLLIPILVKATDDPAISEPLRRFVARRPSWAPDFFSRLADNGPSSAPISAFAQSWGAYRERDNWGVVQKLINRLYRDRRFGEAHGLFLATVGIPPARAPLVYNGDFETTPYFSPFDWQLINDEVSNASIDRMEGHGALFSTIQGSRANAATITLVLSPGSYAITSTARSLDSSQGANGRWLIRCEDAVRDELVSAPFESSNLSGDLGASARFKVPPQGCRAQTLVLERSTANGSEDPGLAVKAVSIRRLGS